MDSTTTGRSCVCIPWRDGVPCPVSAAWHSCVEVKVPLLQAGTVAIWPQMFKIDVFDKPQQILVGLNLFNVALRRRYQGFVCIPLPVLSISSTLFVSSWRSVTQYTNWMNGSAFRFEWQKHLPPNNSQIAVLNNMLLLLSWSWRKHIEPAYIDWER